MARALPHHRDEASDVSQLSLLREGPQTVLLLRYGLEYSVEEVAELSQVSTNTREDNRMMDRDCEKWISIADAAVLGEPVSATEREFEREHQAICARCRGEATIWSRLRPSRLQAVPSKEDVDEILSLAAKEAARGDTRARALPPSPRSIAVAASAGVLAVAASAAIWLGFAAKVERSEAPLAALAQAGASISANRVPPLGSTSEERGTMSSAPTMGLYAQNWCGEIAAGLTLCVAAGSQVSSLELSPPQRVVHLVRGRALASLDSRSAGTSFTIDTKAGRVSAVGATFSVELGPRGEGVARVHHGKVMVRGLGSFAEVSLEEGQAAQLGGSDKVEPMSPQDRARDEHWLSLVKALHVERGSPEWR